nr:MAG TPA: hypothetical protein [Caudoviricetes sp.]
MFKYFIHFCSPFTKTALLRKNALIFVDFRITDWYTTNVLRKYELKINTLCK